MPITQRETGAIKLGDHTHHLYGGAILHVSENRAIHEVEPDVLVVHDSTNWGFRPTVGLRYGVRYDDGVATVVKMASSWLS